jgi:hypothetical protein
MRRKKRKNAVEDKNSFTLLLYSFLLSQLQAVSVWMLMQVFLNGWARNCAYFIDKTDEYNRRLAGKRAKN